MSPNLSLYEGAIVDLDDTLTQSGAYMFTANRALLNEHSFLERFKKSLGGEFDKLPRTAGLDMIQQFNLWIETLKFEATTRDQLQASFNEFLETVWRPKIVNTFESVAPQTIELCPGADRFMSYFTERDRVFGILTNNQRAIAEIILRRSGIEGHKVLTTSNDLNSNKPHPEGHTFQAQALGVDVGSLISVGDSRNDMRAAMGAGMRAGLFIDPHSKITGADLADEFAGRVYVTISLEATMNKRRS